MSQVVGGGGEVLPCRGRRRGAEQIDDDAADSNSQIRRTRARLEDGADVVMEGQEHPNPGKPQEPSDQNTSETSSDEQEQLGLLKTPPQSPEDPAVHSSSDSDDAITAFTARGYCGSDILTGAINKLPTEELERMFDGFDGDLDSNRIATLLFSRLQLPRACGQLVYECLMRPDEREPSGTVDSDSVLNFCKSHLAFRDHNERFFSLMRCHRSAVGTGDSKEPQTLNRDQFGLTVKDMIPLVGFVIMRHPSLKFLSEYRLYFMRFCEFVSSRIVHALGLTMEMMSLRDLRRSKLVDYLKEIETAPDLEKVTTYSFFSLKYFQVVYNKFCRLTTEMDDSTTTTTTTTTSSRGTHGNVETKRVTRHGLCNYGNGSISELFVDRIFCGYMRPLKSSKDGLDFEEFTWFVLCEEDKSKPLSVEALFRCADLDGDGKLSAKDLEPFYDHILDRCWHAGEEEFLFESPFECVHRRLIELLQPDDSYSVSLRDFKKRNVADIFFSVLFDYRKFITLESKETWMAADAQPVDDRAQCLYSDWNSLSGFEKYALWSLALENERWLNDQMAATM